MKYKQDIEQKVNKYATIYNNLHWKNNKYNRNSR